VLYRSDRLAPPHTALPVAPLTPRDSWCTDPSHALYNQQVRQPIQASCVLLWRTDLIFDVIVILGHNDNPVLPGIGSAIFKHVAAEDLKPPKGALRSANRICSLFCVAVIRVPNSMWMH
jgi:L,D-peptidoglycan transpeptidase YkuD (ErfK/YbiS/YcfS/YnhG family)